MQQARTEIIDALIGLVAQNGSAPLDVDAVCKTAGVALSQYHAAFETDAQLVVAAVERIYQRRMAILAQICGEASTLGTVEQVIRAISASTAPDGKTSPVFLSQIGLFFLARQDPETLLPAFVIVDRHEKAIYRMIETALARFMPPAGARFVKTHLEALALISISNNIPESEEMLSVAVNKLASIKYN